MKKTATIKKLERIDTQLKALYKMCQDLENSAAETITLEYGREDVIISTPEDALFPCVMFGNMDMAGIGLRDFIEAAQQPDFDIFEIQTFL